MAGIRDPMSGKQVNHMYVCMNDDSDGDNNDDDV
jgi:hypothetical protein